tara:strand:- start:15986 stop:16735 length:750 start_codon:yes stop_codon:yes gene_type:complete
MQSFIVSEKYKILYCPIAKNACSSLKKMMVDIADLTESVKSQHPDVHILIDEFKLGIQLSEFNEDKKLQILNDKGFFSFVVVREPYKRIVSAYVEKFVLHRLDERQWPHTAPVFAAIQQVEPDNVDYNKGVSFKEFVDYLITTDDGHLDTHWCPQVLYTDKVEFTSIFKMSSISKLADVISSEVGRPIEIGRENQSSNNGIKSSAPLWEKYPSELECLDLNFESFFNIDIESKLRERFKADYSLYARAK